MSVPQYRKAAAIALVAGLGFSIAACSTKGSDDSGKDASGKTVITVDCQPDGSQKDLLANWNADVAEFEKQNPTVTIKSVSVGQQCNNPPDFTARLTGGTMTDVFYGYMTDLQQVLDREPITITDPKMTRFVMTLDEAVDLCLYAFSYASNGDMYVQKAPAVSMDSFAHAVLRVMDRPRHPIRIIGTRHGEKQHETLLSREELATAEDHQAYYRVAPDRRDLNYESFFTDGQTKLTKLEDFNSHNARQLDVDEMAGILGSLACVRDCLDGKTRR